MDWVPADRDSIASILDLIPNGHFVLTAAHGEARCGALVRWVQQCAKSPPMLMVAIEKGQALSAIIRDSRGFAICQVHRDDRILRRMIPRMPENGVDPFLSIPHLRTPSGAPVPLRAMSWFDCELARHVDIEADTEIYVGVVHHASIVQPGATVPCHCAAEPSCPADEGAPMNAAPSAPASAGRRTLASVVQRAALGRRSSAVEAHRRHDGSSSGVAASAGRGPKRR